MTPAKKRHSGPSGKSKLPVRRCHAPKAFWELVDRAIEHNRESKNDGGYANYSDWSRHHLAIAAADELGIDPMEALALLSNGK